MGTEEVAKFLTPQRGQLTRRGNYPKPGTNIIRFPLPSRPVTKFSGLRTKRSHI